MKTNKIQHYKMQIRRNILSLFSNMSQLYTRFIVSRLMNNKFQYYEMRMKRTIPNYELLLTMNSIRFVKGYLNMHSNPRLYKYYWRIFWRNSPCEGPEFLNTRPLVTKAAFELMEKLKNAGEPYWIYNTRIPRDIPLWNMNSSRFTDEGFAPAYEDDCDPEIESGHR